MQLIQLHLLVFGDSARPVSQCLAFGIFVLPTSRPTAPPSTYSILSRDEMHMVTIGRLVVESPRLARARELFTHRSLSY